MKKKLLLIVSLLLCLGFVQAQDIYVSGNHFTTGKVFKNDTLLYSITDSIDIQLQGIRVAEDGTVYGAGYAYNDTILHGCVWMNDSCIFTADTNTYFDHIALNGNSWTAAGGNNVWQNGELLYSYSHGEDDCHIHDLAVDTTTGDIYAGGDIHLSGEYLTYASVWQNDSLLWMADTISSIYSLCFDGGNLYAAGYKIENDSLSYGIIWQNDSIIYQMENANFVCIAAFDGSLYWTGISLTDTVVCIWQDGEVLYSLPELSGISNLVVNESGVYYTDAETVYKDGEVLFEPDEWCILTDLVVKPAPPQPEFTLTVTVNDTLFGSVLGCGLFALGDTATIEAFPNIGCEFLYWNDSITDNPRDIIVTQDSTFIAYFAQIEYLIQTAVVPDSAGIVTEGGNYHYGDTLTLEATANPGYVFAYWNDSITDNPRDIIVTQDSTFTAIFGIQQCTVNTEVTPEGAGTVEGGGVYDYGSVINLVASNNTGYVFSQWTDGVIDNPREILVAGDTTYTAVFSPLQYQISTAANPEHGGTVEGGGIYDYGSTAILTATANMYFEFLCWSDGAVSNPRSVTVTQDATYTALFRQNGTPEYSIIVTTDTPYLGSVTGSGIYLEGSVIEIRAIPNVGVTFAGWDDGNTDNPRNVTVTQDATYIALFEQIPLFTVVVESGNPEMGSTFGGGLFYANSLVTIGALPDSGYYFTGWQDGNMDNPRTFTVTEDVTYIAFFASEPVHTYTITVYYNESQGFILGAGSYVEGSTATLAAIPADNYVFTRWSDGVSDNPREVVVRQDLILAAFFDYTDVAENGNGLIQLYPNPAHDRIHLEGLDGETPVCIYNALGMLVKTTTLYGDADISISDLPAGIYALRLGPWAIRFIKQ